MSDRRLAIVFRNANPQRTPVCSELYLLSAASSAHGGAPDQADSLDANEQRLHLHPQDAASMSVWNEFFR